MSLTPMTCTCTRIHANISFTSSMSSHCSSSSSTSSSPIDRSHGMASMRTTHVNRASWRVSLLACSVAALRLSSRVYMCRAVSASIRLDLSCWVRRTCRPVPYACTRTRTKQRSCACTYTGTSTNFTRNKHMSAIDRYRCTIRSISHAIDQACAATRTVNGVQVTTRDTYT